MGCLLAIPGVQDEGYRRHLKEGGTTIDPELMPDIEPVTLECEKGDVIFMTKYTPHIRTSVAGRWIYASRRQGITRAERHIPILWCARRVLLIL